MILGKNGISEERGVFIWKYSKIIVEIIVNCNKSVIS
jgi:hypothetical protein